LPVYPVPGVTKSAFLFIIQTMRKDFFRTAGPGLLFIGLCLFAACSRTSPKLSFGTLRLVYHNSGEDGAAEERFSFFVLPEDDDGLEDIADLYLYHDREGLVWHITSEEWLSLNIDGNTWIGSRQISMTDGEGLPRGQFRAVLVDKGGERSERIFAFDAPEDSRYPFPFFLVEQGRYRLDSEYPAHYLVCYDGEGNYVMTQPLENPEGFITELNLPSGISGIALWADDDEYLTSALTDIVSLR
jgi:hypothetical protein